jgi:hypothetical protein
MKFADRNLIRTFPDDFVRDQIKLLESAKKRKFTDAFPIAVLTSGDNNAGIAQDGEVIVEQIMEDSTIGDLQEDAARIFENDDLYQCAEVIGINFEMELESNDESA